ncbi:MAG: M28 family metallopeptidase, partial [Gammaproteobacteria bacterium]|nr:M28 family metallopeptidase [Gammaproteobacteria bacterium]
MYGYSLLAACFALFGCGPETSPSTEPGAHAALDLITADGLRTHVEFLSDDAREGRLTGEPGYDAAAAYVAEQFAAIGVAPAGTDGWYQAVSLRHFKIDTESARFVIHRDGEDLPLRYRDDFAISADEVRSENSVRAEVVYVGHGVHAPDEGYSDYDGVDVRGKIVAFFDGAPPMIEGDAGSHYSSGRNKAEEAVARGAVGIISLRSRKAEERKAWDETKKQFGKRPSTTWVSKDGRAAGYYPEIQGAAWLSIESSERLFGMSPMSYAEAHEASLGNVPRSANLGVEVSISVRSDHAELTSPNVIGVVRGSDPGLAKEYVVYSAHLDHVGVIPDDDGGDSIYNGMYDNAMGVALMLETARAIAAAPPMRSVLFIALTGEESGLLGSDYFVNNPTVPVDALVTNINLDMPLFLFPVADLIAFGSQHTSLQAIAENASADEGFVFAPDPIPEEHLFVRSDQ